jgi:hypothetical protein
MKKYISGTNKVYSISSKMVITNEVTGRVLKPHLHHSGYYTIALSIEGKPKYFIRSRLMAIHFIPNPDNLKEVNHKNGVKTDDRICNLEWVTPSQNINHYYKVLGKGKRRKVNQYKMNGKFIKQWQSIAEAARHVNGSSGNLTITCQGKNHYAYGFKWQYA